MPGAWSHGLHMPHLFYENTAGQKNRFRKFAAKHIRASEMPSLGVAMVEAVRDSMIDDRWPWTHTKADCSKETERRMRICEDLLCTLSGDCHWGLERCKDHLPKYLRILLDGGEFTPDERTMWAADDGRIVDMSTNDVRTRIYPRDDASAS